MKAGELSATASSVGCSDDLLWEILIRLPASDLVRLKSVSTQWRRIISDPRFVARHLQISAFRPPTGVILYPHFSNSEPFETVSVPLFQNPPPPRVPSLSFMTKTLANFHCRFTQIQSCNGLLLCVFSHTYWPMLHMLSRCFVCNPTTRAFKLLPLPPYLGEGEWFDGLTTLAFNPLEPLRYKVIGIKKHLYKQNEMPQELHIYSSETNCWKFGCFLEEFKANKSRSGAFLNDTVYWIGSYKMHYYNVYSGKVGILWLRVVRIGFPPRDSLLVTTCGRLYFILYQSKSGEWHEYEIFEFDSTTMSWSDPRVERLGLESEVVHCYACPKVVAREDNLEDFFLLLASEKSLITFDLGSHRCVREIKFHRAYSYEACHYIPSLAPV